MLSAMIRSARYTASLCAVIMMISGCENTHLFDSNAIVALRKTDPASITSPYYLSLSRHYLHYAESLHHRSNPFAADMMAKRGLEAARQFPPVLHISQDALTPEHHQARAFVSYVTSNPRLQVKVPDELAQLRWLYDCWEHESSVEYVGTMASECRNGYYVLADQVFSEFAPGYVAHDNAEHHHVEHIVALHPLLKQQPEKDHPMITPVDTETGAAQTAVPSQDISESAMQSEAEKETLIVEAPAGPTPQELLDEALKENPFLSVAERERILGTPALQITTPIWVRKPARLSKNKQQRRIAPKIAQKPSISSVDASLLKKRTHYIRFDSGASTLNTDATDYAKKLGAVLASVNTGNIRVTVNGYSDDKDGAEANMRLSLQRALAVKNALVAAGADISDVDAFAYADKQAPERAGQDGDISFRTAEIIIKQ